MPLRLRFLRWDEAGRFRTSHSFAGHFANYLGGRKDFLLAFARHSDAIRIFAHSTRKGAII